MGLRERTEGGGTGDVFLYYIFAPVPKHGVRPPLGTWKARQRRDFGLGVNKILESVTFVFFPCCNSGWIPGPQGV